MCHRVCDKKRKEKQKRINSMLYSYSFSNRKRDLSDILSTVIREEPRFISNFKSVPDARMRKHEWLEDQMQGRSIKAESIHSGILTVSAADAPCYFNFPLYRKTKGN